MAIIKKTPVAESIPFDNDTNGFAADDVQEAIEEVGASAELPVFPIVLQHNGIVADGTFFGYSELIPGDATPIIVPIDSVFAAFTFSNNRSNADYTLLFRKNSTVAPAFYTVSKVNTQFFVDILGTPESFSGGDQIYVEYQDDGLNARDVGITLYFRAT